MGYDLSRYLSKTGPDTSVRVSYDPSVKDDALTKKKKAKNHVKNPSNLYHSSQKSNSNRSKRASERKLFLKEAIESGDITSVEQASEALNLSPQTIHHYLTDLKLKL